MKKQNRDLLVLFKQGSLTPQDMDMEVNRLHQLLVSTEKMDSIITTHELLDLNTYKIEKGYVPIVRFVRQKKEIPFVFLNCLN